MSSFGTTADFMAGTAYIAEAPIAEVQRSTAMFGYPSGSPALRKASSRRSLTSSFRNTWNLLASATV